MLNTNNHPVGAHTKIILLFGCSLILIAGWWACALSYFPDYSLPLGSVANPTAGTTMYWAIWGVWGSCICILLTLSLSSFHARLQIPQQYLYLIGAAGTAAAIYIRKAIYQGMDITDDESVYRHAALLLTSGQLSESSHPLKIFFDHTFMVNDGKFYGQYFIGWPLDLAFGYLIKIADFVNALLFGGTIILIYRIAQKHTDDLMATAAALLALISPANLFSAGTMLSHTSCSFFIVLAIFLIEKLHSQSLSMRYTILLGCSCGLAFLIRPLTTVCLLTPFAIPCLLALFNKRDYHSITVWLLTSSVFVLALLMVNHAQTGFWHKTGYEAYSEYAYTNQFRFSWWNLTAQPLSIDPRNAYSFNIIQFI